MIERYEFPDKLKKSFFILMGIGAILLLIGSFIILKGGGGHDDHGSSHASVALASADNSFTVDATESGSGGHHSTKQVSNTTRFGVVVIVGFIMFMLISIFGVFFISISYPAKAGYMVATRRILETYFYYIPVIIVIGAIFYFVFADSVYEWAYTAEGVSELIDGKRPVLNKGMLMFTCFFLPVICLLMGFWYRKNGKAEEAYADNKDNKFPLHFTAVRRGVMFLPVFMIGLLLTSWILVMSVDPKWYSTIYWVYLFAGMFVMGATITGMIISYLKENNHLKKVTKEHMHDYGKWMFAISVFWAYIWISQLLLIWYANIPEETIYYRERWDGYMFLFWLNLAINFIFPFLVLMMREMKRDWKTIRVVGSIMLFGRFLDIYLLIVPGVLGAGAGMGVFVASLGFVVLQAGVFLWLVFSNLSKENLYPIGHPYLEESFHYDTGV